MKKAIRSFFAHLSLCFSVGFALHFLPFQATSLSIVYADENTVAFMAGSFDMPTKAHISIMKTALAEEGTSKLYIMVNTLNGPKDYYTSFGQRKKMILQALGDLASKVEIVSEPIGGFSQCLDNIKTPSVDKIRVFVGEDAYRSKGVIPKHLEYRLIHRPGQEREISADPQIHFISIPDLHGISSSHARKLIYKGHFDELASSIPPEVIDYIRQKHLYSAPRLGDHESKRDAYRQAWKAFAEKHIRSSHRFLPRSVESLARNSHAGPEIPPAPPFNLLQHESEWHNKFRRHMRRVSHVIDCVKDKTPEFKM